jgi:ATP-dependent DNA helicase PIF1
MLNEMRLGTLSEESIKNFQSLSRKPQFDDDIEPTELYPTRNEVDSANNVRMHSLPGSTHVFTAEEGGAITNTQFRNKLLANCMAPSRLDLKKDAQVMLIKNMDDNLVNGSLGKVVGFMSENTYSLCEREGIDVESALGLDSKAAGLSDDPYGFASIEEDPEDSESVARKKRRILKLRAMSAETSQLWPLVRFTTATGLHIDRLVTREKWSFETPEGEVQAYRRQIPLILAYAISIHKAQGQTLSRVRVDLGRVFEKGQAYVALSRATCREGLQILRFDAKKVMAHPRVGAFYRQLENVDEVKRRESSKAGRLDEVGVGWDKETLDDFMEDEIVAYG